jgi:para-aminobenzoate synthetase component 1
MISTVTSKLDLQYSAVDALKPLSDGKYDGAPKISVMKIIEQLEETKRVIWCRGYFLPNGDFDFNVVTSILYNKEKNMFHSL